MSEKGTLVLVDGSSLAFRAFFALATSNLRSADGTPTWAVLGFFNSLFDLIEKYAPQMMAVCFDLSGPTFRHIEFEEYKAHRDEMPDDLRVQWPIIKAGIQALSIPLYELAGYEADDIIGTVAKQAEDRDLPVMILTGDKDAFQLLDGKIQVLMPSKETKLAVYGRQEVFDKMGVWPEQIIDYKALCGDTSDNIPGVKGIGPKTAVQLLGEYKTLDGIYANLDKIKSASVKTKLETSKDIAYQSQRLATIVLDVPLDFDFEHCNMTLPDVERVAGFFRTVESSSILRRLPKILANFNGGKVPEIDPDLLLPIGKTGRSRGPEKAQAPEPVKAAPSTPAARNGSVALAEPPAEVKTARAPAKVVDTGKPVDLHKAAAATIIDTPAQLQELVARLSQQSLVGLELLPDSHDSHEAAIIGAAFVYNDGIAHDGKQAITTGDTSTWHSAYVRLNGDALTPAVFAQTMKPVLTAETPGKVAFNAKAQANLLALIGIELGGLAFDPMLASYVINPNDKHAQALIAKRVLDFDLPSDSDLLGTGKKQISPLFLPPDTAAGFTCSRARVNLALACAFGRQAEPDQCELLYDMEQPLTLVLAKMEQAGIKLDLPYFSNLGSELGAEIARKEEKIYKLAGHPFNINSPLQLQKVLFEELKLPAKTKTKSGYSTDASVLEVLRPEHPIIDEILEYRHVAKLQSTYVESLPRQVSARDGRLHGEFNQTVAATGRLSSTNPNLQNIPIKTELGRRIRKGFVAKDKDHVLISADYSQIELRLLAHMSGDEKLIAAFQADIDIHAATAATIFDIAPQKVTSEQRRVGKTLNFALIYQQGAYSTAQDLGISTKEAQAFIEKYFSNFPKVKGFLTSIIDNARQNGYVQTLWGRRRYFDHLTDSSEMLRRAEERAACNAPLQGSAADLIKLAMIRLDKDLKEAGSNAQLILQVHDELVLDSPVSELEQTKQIVLAAMQLDQPLAVPLKVDMGVAPNWMDAK